MRISQRNWQIANDSMKAAFGGSVGSSRRNGATRMMFKSGFNNERKNAKKKDSRLVSVYSHIPQWPTKNEYGRPSRSGRKARHDGSKVKVEESDHGEETEDRVGRKHPHSADHSQGKKEAARDDEEAPRDAA